VRAIHRNHIGGLAAPDRLDRGGMNYPEVAIPPWGVQRERRDAHVKGIACLGVPEQPEVPSQVIVKRRCRQQNAIFEFAVKYGPVRA
jgi:hypothetical protein